MAYDEQLADRVRTTLEGQPDVTERKMFGGLAIMVAGNMACGVVGSELMLRLGPEGAESALGEEHVRPMDFTGRPLRGMVLVAPAALEDERSLRRWVERGCAFARTLPAKG